MARELMPVGREGRETPEIVARFRSRVSSVWVSSRVDPRANPRVNSLVNSQEESDSVSLPESVDGLHDVSVEDTEDFEGTEEAGEDST